MSTYAAIIAAEAALADACKDAVASLPSASLHAEKQARNIAAHRAWAKIIRSVHKQAATDSWASGWITEVAGCLSFDAAGEEFGHYKVAPTAHDVEAFIIATSPSNAYLHLLGMAGA